MIKFTHNNIRVDIVKLKSVTAALGGAIRVVDEKASKKKGREVYARIPVSQTLVRAFAKAYRATKFIRPIETALVYYHNNVVAIERGPIGAHILKENDPTWKWTPDCYKNIAQLMQKTSDGVWYTDGRQVYQVPTTKDAIVKVGKNLNADKSFYSVSVTATNLASLNTPTHTLKEDMSASIAFITKDGQVAVSAPVFKMDSNLGMFSIKDNRLPLEDINTDHAVSLNFVLYAGKTLSETFGHEILDVLQLPKLMVQLKTVNLPRLGKEMKETVDSQLPFTHALAWLIGLGEKAKTIDQYMIVRAALKYLITKGSFERKKLMLNQIFAHGHNRDSIPLMTSTEALDSAIERGFRNVSMTDAAINVKNLDRLMENREVTYDE